MPSNWPLWDRVREWTRSHRVYSQQSLATDQQDITRVLSPHGSYASTINNHTTEQAAVGIGRFERYRDYAHMDKSGEISLALDLYADEISSKNAEHKHCLIIRAQEKRIKDELYDLFHNVLLVDKWIRPAARYLCKYGDAPFEIVLDRDRNGVTSLRQMDVGSFTRLESLYGDLIGFFYQDEGDVGRTQPEFMHPWSCMHMKLTNFENEFEPYGISVLEPSRRPFKQLRLMEDAALIYRLTRAAERRIFTVPVGNIPTKDIPQYMQDVARSFKRRRFYDPATGTFDERWSPITQEDDFFLPQRPDGSGPKIDTLPGAENLDQIADIEYFKKKVVAPLKVPYSRVGIGSDAGKTNEKSLSQIDAEFAKAVEWIQSEIALSLTKVAIIHLSLRGYTEEDLKSFELHLANSSAIEELYRMETWQSRVATMSDLKDLGWFPKEWIVTHFTDLSPDEIQALKDVGDEESGPNALGSNGGGFGDGFGDGDTGLGDTLDDAFGDDDLPGGIDSDLDFEGGGLGGDDDEESSDDLLAGLGLESTVMDSDIDDRKLMVEMSRYARDATKEHRTEIINKMANFVPIDPKFSYLHENNEFDGLTGHDHSAKMLVEDLEYDDYIFPPSDVTITQKLVSEHANMFLEHDKENINSDQVDIDV